MIRSGRLAAAILTLALAGTACTRLGIDPAELGRTPTPAVGPVSPLPPIEPGTQPIVEVVERVSPAVVNVRTNLAADAPAGQGGQGTGTGFVVRPDGVAVTNFHVVQGAFSIEVTTADGRDFEARVIGADPNADLAVLRMEAEDLPTVDLGNSEQLALGETVVALGFALALEGGPSVTSGIVSAKGRTIEAGDSAGNVNTLEDLIQTDAAINPGNSGGPLLNLKGDVVGINTAVIASAHGIGFAISASTAKSVVKELIAKGRVVRASLGVVAVSLTPQLAYTNDLPIERGALVLRVDEGGAGDAAGVEPGDVITSVAGRPVTNLHHLHAVLGRHRIGEAVDVSVWRGGRAVTLRPVLGEEP
jgi:serine protease Do